MRLERHPGIIQQASNRLPEAASLQPETPAPSRRTRRTLTERFQTFQDRVGEKIVARIKRIPEMEKRAEQIEARPHENPFRKEHFPRLNKALRTIGETTRKGWD